MKSISYYCIGESHIAIGKPCQDCAYTEHSASLSMAIVCDGHGGEKYFRSDYGSKIAVKIAKDSIRSFVDNMLLSSFNNEGKLSVFANSSFCAYRKDTATDKQINSKAHKVLVWLFSSIISQWNDAIALHARNHDVTEEEMKHVNQKYIDEFTLKQNDPEATFEKTYGCTIMAYVQTPNYWFAFQLGDGKFVAMNKINEEIVFTQPIPWDEKCFLNKTTSICDAYALEEFRYCYQGDGNFPLAVFLGSDGMDDSYGDGENLYNFYANLYKQIAKSGYDVVQKLLKSWLPEISKIGSKDDISVACIYNENEINFNFYAVNQYQKKELENRIANYQLDIEKLQNKVELLDTGTQLDRNGQINLQYAKTDLAKAQKAQKDAKKALKELQDEVIRFDRGKRGQPKSQKKLYNNNYITLGYKKVKRITH